MARVARKGTADRKGDCRPKKRGKRQIIIIIIIIIVIEKGGKKRRKGLGDGGGRRARVRGGCTRRQKVRLCVLCLVAKQKNSYERTCRPASKKKNQSRWSNLFLFFLAALEGRQKEGRRGKEPQKKKKRRKCFLSGFFSVWAAAAQRARARSTGDGSTFLLSSGTFFLCSFFFFVFFWTRRRARLVASAPVAATPRVWHRPPPRSKGKAAQRVTGLFSFVVWSPHPCGRAHAALARGSETSVPSLLSHRRAIVLRRSSTGRKEK